MFLPLFILAVIPATFATAYVSPGGVMLPCWEDPGPKDACDILLERLMDITGAVAREGCPSSDESSIVDTEQCDAIAEAAIPTCMDGEEDTEACMKEETAEAPVTLAQCKCQAFEQIRTDLMDVVEMICPSDRMPMNTGSISPILIWY